MLAKIYQPSRNAMQSGQAHADRWVLEYEAEGHPAADPLMGYTSSSDMLRQVRMEFDDREKAIAYAERHNIPFRVVEPRKKVVRPVSYSDNFRSDRAQPWTH